MPHPWLWLCLKHIHMVCSQIPAELSSQEGGEADKAGMRAGRCVCEDNQSKEDGQRVTGSVPAVAEFSPGFGLSRQATACEAGQ